MTHEQGAGPAGSLPRPPDAGLVRPGGGDDQYRHLIERLPVVSYTAEFGLNGRWHFVSPQIESMLGYTPGEWSADPELWADRIHPDDRARVLADEEDSRSTLRSFSCDYRLVGKTGRVVWVRDEGVVTVEPGSGATFMQGILLDITEQKRAEEALAEAEERFRQAFSNAPIGMALVRLDGGFIQVNRSLCDIVRYARDELLSRTFQDITHPEDLEKDLAHSRRLVAGEIRDYQLEKRYIHSEGRTVWVSLSVSLVRDAASEPLYFIAQIEDIDERREARDRLEYLADHDALTGLFNRRRFDEELARQAAHSERYRTGIALLLLDLDNFKGTNDTLGHKAGDELLKAVVALLANRLRKTDVLCRLGGDEFAVLLPEVDEAEARTVAEELAAAIRAEPFLLSAGPVRTTASIGVAVVLPGVSTSPESLLMDADLAMYEAKGSGRDRCVVRLPGATEAARG